MSAPGTPVLDAIAVAGVYVMLLIVSAKWDRLVARWRAWRHYANVRRSGWD